MFIIKRNCNEPDESYSCTMLNMNNDGCYKKNTFVLFFHLIQPILHSPPETSVLLGVSVCGGGG